MHAKVAKDICCRRHIGHVAHGAAEGTKRTLARRVVSIPARWRQAAYERREGLDELYVDLRIRKPISVVAPFTLERVADVTLRVQHAPHEVRNISQKGFDAKARY